jgi:hypothetical protein
MVLAWFHIFRAFFVDRISIYILKTYTRVGLDSLLLVMTPEHSSGLYNLVAEHTAQAESALSESDSVHAPNATT